MWYYAIGCYSKWISNNDFPGPINSVRYVYLYVKTNNYSLNNNFFNYLIQNNYLNLYYNFNNFNLTLIEFSNLNNFNNIYSNINNFFLKFYYFYKIILFNNNFKYSLIISNFNNIIISKNKRSLFFELNFINLLLLILN